MKTAKTAVIIHLLVGASGRSAVIHLLGVFQTIDVPDTYVSCLPKVGTCYNALQKHTRTQMSR